MMRWLLINLIWALIWLGALSAATIPAHAQERITDFDVGIVVEMDGDIVVTENITVVSEGRKIRRGIFRELPRTYTFKDVEQRYNYKLLSIERDGASEDYTRLSEGDALIWRIGNADVFLPDGTHRYTIRYRVGNEVRRHPDKHEVYWNATGTYWDFPIERARATVTFPDGAEIVEQAAYSGAFGADGREAVDIDIRRNVATFEMEDGLPPREGLTVAVAISPDLLDPPSLFERIRPQWIRYGAILPALLVLGGVFMFYYRKWDKVGRDPARHPVFPRYAPPDGYGPAAVNIIHNRSLKGMDWFTAEVTKLACDGHVEIEAEKNRTFIKRIADGPRRGSVGRKILDDVINRQVGNAIELGKNVQNKRFFRSLTKLQSELRSTYGAPYFRSNGGWVVGGCMLSFVLMFVFMIVAAVAQVSVAVMGLVVIAGFVAINAVFAVLLRARSEKGARVSAEIEGFKLYLETAETARINTANPLGDDMADRPPAMSVKLYERFLPYAVALGVEKPWTKQFERTLPEIAQTYVPRGMSGRNIRPGRPIATGRAMRRGLSRGVASAAPVSRSNSSGGFSSGSSGGGSSGGGGGGGGGGGW